MKKRLFICVVLFLILIIKIQAQHLLGNVSYSTLSWKQIASSPVAALSIGLTKDNRMYVWGNNNYHTILTRSGYQGTPYFVPSPVGETINKVDVMNTTFLCLSQSGKLYGWGTNTGIMGNASSSWPIVSLPGSVYGDTTKAIRRPVSLTINGETSFVDFGVTRGGEYWIAVSSSGKAYHIGSKEGGGTNISTTFSALNNPAGVSTSFKYVAVWLPNGGGNVYLKGNDGNIYYCGIQTQGRAVGVPSLWYNPIAGTYPDGGVPAPSADMTQLVPLLVPFPSGVDIVNISFNMIGGNGSHANNLYALSSNGKAFGVGLWRSANAVSPQPPYYVFPLKSTPANTDVAKYQIGGIGSDTLYVLKRFQEIAMPPGATSIIDIGDHSTLFNSSNLRACIIIDNQNKVWWAGQNYNNSDLDFSHLPNFLQYNSDGIVCNSTTRIYTTSPSQWNVEAIGYRNATQINHLDSPLYTGSSRFIIDKDGRGYFEGRSDNHSGLGKLNNFVDMVIFPTPIANEQLDNCNTSPGTGGPLTGPVTPTNTAVGTIDCSKTKIAPAPVAGVPSQTTLIVSVNVTTAGTFTPITVSGSGMSLGNGITSVSTTTTGVQTFYIPLQYDGSALSNSFQFSIGSAGSCSADLTQKSNKQVTNVWSLTNCSAITPGVLSK